MMSIYSRCFIPALWGILVFLHPVLLAQNVMLENEDNAANPQQQDELKENTSDIDLQVILKIIDSLDPNVTKMEAWEVPGKYWQPHYHPQVTREIFSLIQYPYYPNGMTYPQQNFTRLTDVIFQEISQSINSKDATTTDEATSSLLDTSTSNMESTQLSKDDETSTNKPEIINKSFAIDYEQLTDMRYKIERCSDLVHRWRQINESNNMLLEIVRSCELTKTSTEIYRINPPLAIQVKRIIGKIGQVNRNFDVTSRLTFQTILMGQNVDKILLSRMEKQLADLESLLIHLHENNDQIGIAIGLGRLDRNIKNDETISFSNLKLNIGDLSLSEQNSPRGY